MMYLGLKMVQIVGRTAMLALRSSSLTFRVSDFPAWCVEAMELSVWRTVSLVGLSSQ